MLKKGGAFARFANHPFRDKDNLLLANQIERLYAKYYNSYYNIEEKIRTELFAKIQEAINNNGGTITIYDTIDLQLARK